MDQLIFASLSHTHYWYEVGMLKVPAVYMRIFRVQFRFSQVPRLVKFLDRIYLVQTSAQSNAHAQLCYQGLCQPPQYL